ncbi:3-oxoacyl-ACP reductase FabG [Teredinibacter sp. KSP-S5-2]|uniref:3-oxoacyl-ACP reductase FabG n=1 Tax=Teredinibacter sp. KSP-S5-2 TaxID=3034506 RepID=UPI002934C964|nr:3-oxoacyl-ACP reductase FabG [Teredinibacter sp. KSP-S5-2]WNO10925.1 3-oxoacyl-ACP reductase FabG [Teredinibacter sp. KSP-S5-2]
MTLEGKVALVTGASRGIGEAIANRLAESGAVVVGTATSEGGAEKISARMEAAGYKGEGMMLNVTDPDSVAQVLKAIQEKYGAPAILVNNAGITRDNLMLRMSEEEWFDVINTNLSAVFRLSKACLRGMMKARWGRIVNISSVVGQMGNPGQANYAATKAGVAGFARSLAKEVASRGITVNSVAPGFIETDMTKALNDDQRNSMMGAIPSGRFGKPEEIAGVVSFLCSEDASYLTGETLQVNGGMYMR